MVLVGIPLAPGRGSGPARRIVGDEPDGWRHGPAGRVVVARGDDWPPADVGPPAVLGAVLQERPTGGGSGVRFPIVGGLDADVFLPDDRLTVDGDRGTVEIAGVGETEVVTAFLERSDGKILLLRRSQKVGSFRGRWAGVSGYLEDPTPEGQAVREIGEETGLPAGAVALRRAGRVVYARDGPRLWAVHPFRFRVDRPDVTIDWEHTEFEWVAPSEIERRPVVPKLDRAWAAVAPGPDEVRKA